MRQGAFPKWQEGRHPHCHFRGLHRLHSVTARRIAQPPKVTFVTRLQPSRLPGQPLVSFRTYRQLSGWNPPPQVFRAFGAHCQFFYLVRRNKRQAYSITSSARARSDGGMVSPSAFAVLRLINNSYFVGCSTGKSAGLAPLRILSTKDAARRQTSVTLGP